jgi:dipeptidyl aminopeptidase/acylaminoacyl peptidase
VHITEDRVYRFWDTWLTDREVNHLFVIDLATSHGARSDAGSEAVVFDWMDRQARTNLSPRRTRKSHHRICPRRGEVAHPLGDLHRAGRQAGAVTCLTQDHPADDIRPRYTPDGKSIVYGMQHDPFLLRGSHASHALRPRGETPRRMARQLESVAGHWEFGNDGTLYLETEDAGRVSLFALKGNDAPREVARGGSIGAVAPASDRARVLHAAIAGRAPRLHAIPANGRRAREAHALHRADAREREARAKCARCSSRRLRRDGADVRGSSADYRADSKPPLVHVIHGGPHGITPDAFHFRWNGQLVSRTRLRRPRMVNFQGSTSWARTSRSDSGRLGAIGRTRTSCVPTRSPDRAGPGRRN